MRRFLIILVWLVLVTSIGLFVMTLFVPDLLKPFNSLLCAEGTSIDTNSYQSGPGETSIDFVCRDVDGIIVEYVSGKLMAPFFAVMFGGAVLLVILSAFGKRRSPSVAQQVISSVKQAKSPYNDDPELLSEKLQQLQSALDMGLITQEEYERKRREIIDSF